MKTHNYNPSEFEIHLASAITACEKEIQKNMKNNLKIIETEHLMDRDNPMLVFHLQDKDGDMHEVVVKIIQRPDSM